MISKACSKCFTPVYCDNRPVTDVRCSCCGKRVIKGKRTLFMEKLFKYVLVVAVLVALIILGMTLHANAEIRVLSQKKEIIHVADGMNKYRYIVRLDEEVCVEGKLFVRYTVQTVDGVSVDMEQVFTGSDNVTVKCE